MRHFIALACVVLASCSDTRNLNPTEVWNIILAGDALMEQFPTVPGQVIHPERDDWPAALMLLSPEAVSVEVTGVHIRLDSFFVEESGLYVLAATVRTEPPGRGADPSYERVAPRLYRYKVKG
jgi:hypothetical protein